MLTTTASAHNASQTTSNFGPGRLGSREASLRAGARDKIGDLQRRLERQSRFIRPARSQFTPRAKELVVVIPLVRIDRIVVQAVA